jgi:small multidrug resistance family-3 protein
VGANRPPSWRLRGPRFILLRLAMTGRSIALFGAAPLAEIGGAYLIWIGLREGKGPPAVAAGAVALIAYGLIAARQSSNEFGRVLAAYGGVIVVGSLLWGVAFDGFSPDRFDFLGAAICLVGVGAITYVPR